jgi:acetyltransferase-like isoleucine patch superfamily enzyme
MKLYVPLLKRNGMKITGKPRYIGFHVKFDNFDNIHLGDRVVISDECFLLTHDYSITTALIAINKMPKSDIQLIRDIKIGNNVFIGKRSIIMPNAEIGNNVIIGAGSVVRGKIPNNSIVMGNPATIVGNIKEQALKWETFLDTNFVKED